MTCQECKDEVDELFTVRIDRGKRKLCEDCHERYQEQQEIAAEAGGVIRDLMEYKG